MDVLKDLPPVTKVYVVLRKCRALFMDCVAMELHPAACPIAVKNRPGPRWTGRRGTHPMVPLIEKAIKAIKRLKKDEAVIRAEIKRIESDERYSYPPAQVQINAPLALIQVEMKAQVRMLRWVLSSPKKGAGS